MKAQREIVIFLFLYTFSKAGEYTTTQLKKCLSKQRGTIFKHRNETESCTGFEPTPLIVEKPSEQKVTKTNYINNTI